MEFLKSYQKDILMLCKAHKVKSLYAFGFVLTNKFNQNSDIDLIVDFEPMDVLDYGDNYFDLKLSLVDILKRKIDLLEDWATKNQYFRKTLNDNKVLIYG